MSAFIVSKGLIDRLVTAGRILGVKIDDQLSLSEMGRYLWSVNYESVNYRYGRHDEAPPYEFEEADVSTGIVGKSQWLSVVKDIHCYGYQSCEHMGWVNSPAQTFCADLTSAIRKRLGVAEGVDMRDLPGYADAPWGR